MKNIIILAVLCWISFISCQSTGETLSISQEQPVYPVLKLKDYNNIIDLKITNSDTAEERTIRQVLINTYGTTSLEDIESMALYYTGTTKKDIGDNSVLVAGTKDISSITKLNCSFNLKGAENHFRISYKLKDDADILHRIGGFCEKINTDQGTIIPKNHDNPEHLRMGVAVRKHLDDNVDTYRIPGLVLTNKGSLLAVYDARRDSRRDLQGDIDIGISRSIDGGSTWEPMVIALDMGEWGSLPHRFNGVSDASLLVDSNSDNIFVAGLWMYGVLDDKGQWIENLNDTSKAWNHQWRNRGSQPGFDVKQSSQFLISKSNDDGISWDKPVNLTGMCKKKEWWLWAPAPGNGITLTDGTLVFPTQGRDKGGIPFSNISYSSDGGLTWKTSTPASTQTTECAVVQLDNGSLMLNMRYNLNRNNEGPDNGRFIAVTDDMGESWRVHPTSTRDLIEPVCMASLIRHTYLNNGKSETILFFSNPSTKRGRHHITIKASIDNGNTWPEEYQVMLDEGTGKGYSSLAAVDNDHIGILYESSQANMVFQKIPLKEILNNYSLK